MRHHGWGAARSDFADVVSAVWENRVCDQRLMVVLSGSAVAVMEEMLGPHGGAAPAVVFHPDVRTYTPADML